MRRLILVLSSVLALLVMTQDYALATEDHHTLGVQAGQVGLLGDVASTYNNALGFGAFFDYAASDYIEFEFSFLTSHHQGTPSTGTTLNLTQNDFGLALLYDIDTFDMFTPYLRGGAEFVNHTQDFTTATGISNTGFGLQFGIGARADLGKNLMAGLDFTYHDIFDVSTTPPGSAASVKAIQSFYTVMLRFGFSFGGK